MNEQPDKTQPQRNETPEPPKIRVDDDWKAQAEEEKKRLAEEVESVKLPEASFSSLVSAIVTQILFSLGDVKTTDGRQLKPNLELAKFHIDTLAMLQEKTRGNLTEDEKKLLEAALYEVRMRYVQVADSIR